MGIEEGIKTGMGHRREVVNGMERKVQRKMGSKGRDEDK